MSSGGGLHLSIGLADTCVIPGGLLRGEVIVLVDANEKEGAKYKRIRLELKGVEHNGVRDDQGEFDALLEGYTADRTYLSRHVTLAGRKKASEDAETAAQRRQELLYREHHCAPYSRIVPEKPLEKLKGKKSRKEKKKSKNSNNVNNDDDDDVLIVDARDDGGGGGRNADVGSTSANGLNEGSGGVISSSSGMRQRSNLGGDSQPASSPEYERQQAMRRNSILDGSPVVRSSVGGGGSGPEGRSSGTRNTKKKDPQNVFASSSSDEEEDEEDKSTHVITVEIPGRMAGSGHYEELDDPEAVGRGAAQGSGGDGGGQTNTIQRRDSRGGGQGDIARGVDGEPLHPVVSNAALEIAEHLKQAREAEEQAAAAAIAAAASGGTSPSQGKRKGTTEGAPVEGEGKGNTNPVQRHLKERRLLPGRYSFPFSFRVPPWMPPSLYYSITGACGNITYTARATVEFGGAQRSITSSKRFFVLSAVSKRQLLGAQEEAVLAATVNPLPPLSAQYQVFSCSCLGNLCCLYGNAAIEVEVALQSSRALVLADANATYRVFRERQLAKLMEEASNAMQSMNNDGSKNTIQDGSSNQNAMNIPVDNEDGVMSVGNSTVYDATHSTSHGGGEGGGTGAVPPDPPVKSDANRKDGGNEGQPPPVGVYEGRGLATTANLDLGRSIVLKGYDAFAERNKPLGYEESLQNNTNINKNAAVGGGEGQGSNGLSITTVTKPSLSSQEEELRIRKEEKLQRRKEAVEQALPLPVGALPLVVRVQNRCRNREISRVRVELQETIQIFKSLEVPRTFKYPLARYEYTVAIPPGEEATFPARLVLPRQFRRCKEDDNKLLPPPGVRTANISTTTAIVVSFPGFATYLEEEDWTAGVVQIAEAVDNTDDVLDLPVRYS